jgi:hypothetical protein
VQADLDDLLRLPVMQVPEAPASAEPPAGNHRFDHHRLDHLPKGAGIRSCGGSA